MKTTQDHTELTTEQLAAKLTEAGTAFKVIYGFAAMEYDDANMAAAMFLTSPVATSIKAAKTTEDMYSEVWSYEYSKEPMF